MTSDRGKVIALFAQFRYTKIGQDKNQRSAVTRIRHLRRAALGCENHSPNLANAASRTYYVGLDVSLRCIHICVIDEGGELLAEGKSDSEVANIIAFLDELDADAIKVGLGAGTLIDYLTAGLQFVA